jgi:hypothetical protein
MTTRATDSPSHSFSSDSPKRSIGENPSQQKVEKPKDTTETPTKQDQSDNAANTKATLEDTSDEEDVWEVESILGAKILDGRLSYFVRWAGCPMNQSSWVPEAECNCLALIEEFHGDIAAAKLRQCSPHSIRSNQIPAEPMDRTRFGIERVELESINFQNPTRIAIQEVMKSDEAISYVCSIGGGPPTTLPAERVREEFPIELLEFLQSRVSHS